MTVRTAAAFGRESRQVLTEKNVDLTLECGTLDTMSGEAVPGEDWELGARNTRQPGNVVCVCPPRNS